MSTSRLTTASPALCIHDATPDKCCVCNGYAKWLLASEGRLERAQANPEASRQEFRRYMESPDWIVVGRAS